MLAQGNRGIVAAGMPALGQRYFRQSRELIMDLVALNAEYVDNTTSMPYLAFVEANDNANADVINNASGANGRTVNNESVATGDVRGVTSFEAFDGLVTSSQAWFEWLTANGSIPVNDEILQQLAGIGGTSFWAIADRAQMEPRMEALMQRIGSRAEEIADVIGASTVRPSDVANARNV